MKYTITAPTTIGPGIVLGLSDAQAAARSGRLRLIGKGKYEVVAEVQFKAGETIYADTELPKALADAMIPTKKAATAGAVVASEEPKAP